MGGVAMKKDASIYYRSQIAVYTDNIRMADFKANVAVIYGAFTIGPVLGVAEKLPPYLPLPAVLLPFAVVFFALLVCLFPRYPRRAAATLIIKRDAKPDDFRSPSGREAVLEQQRTLCVLLCNILYWKTFCIRISFGIYILGTILAALILMSSYL
jgi:hypothetical protein